MSETVFMVMPFGDELANTIYKHSTKPIIESLKLRIIRADEIFSSNPVFDDIVTAIEQASIVVVDISGRNPNCFYELGMAHTLKRGRTIMITHDQFDDVPFDIAHFRIIKYEDSIAGKTLYEDNLRKTLHTILTGLSELYLDEFRLAVKTFKGLKQEGCLYALQALEKSNRPISLAEIVDCEGHYQRPEMATHFHGQFESYARPFIHLGYVALNDGTPFLTDKGRAFVGFTATLGYAVDRFNEQIFTEGFTSFFEMMKQREAERKSASQIPPQPKQCGN